MSCQGPFHYRVRVSRGGLKNFLYTFNLGREGKKHLLLRNFCQVNIFTIRSWKMYRALIYCYVFSLWQWRYHSTQPRYLWDYAKWFCLSIVSIQSCRSFLPTTVVWVESLSTEIIDALSAKHYKLGCATKNGWVVQFILLRVEKMRSG